MPGDKNSTCVSSRWNVSISVESHPHCKGCALSHLYVKVVFSAWLSLSLPVSLPTFKNHVFCDVSLLPAEIKTPQPQNDKCIMKCNWWPSAQGKLFLISNAKARGALKRSIVHWSCREPLKPFQACIHRGSAPMCVVLPAHTTQDK